MKTNPSRYVLAAEILTIILFHAVKIKQAEKHPSETVLNATVQTINQPKSATENKSGFEYMLVKLFP
jgi:hypothetical protein